MQSLHELDKLELAEPIMVPHDLLKYVDQGINPDGYLKALLEETVHHNQVTNGKVEAIKVCAMAMHSVEFILLCFVQVLHTALQESMAQAYAEEFAKYQEFAVPKTT